MFARVSCCPGKTKEKPNGPPAGGWVCLIAVSVRCLFCSAYVAMSTHDRRRLILPGACVNTTPSSGSIAMCLDVRVRCPKRSLFSRTKAVILLFLAVLPTAVAFVDSCSWACGNDAQRNVQDFNIFYFSSAVKDLLTLSYSSQASRTYMSNICTAVRTVDHVELLYLPV